MITSSQAQRMFPTAASITEKLPRIFRRHKLMSMWMQLTREDPVQLVRIRDDLFGYADMSDGFLRLIVIDKGFEVDFFRIADLLFVNGGTFLDVGANYGLLSFGLAGRHGDAIDFHLFEPNPKLVKTLARTQALYPKMRCIVNQVAISDSIGSTSFLINNTQSGISRIALHGEEGISVPTTSIDAYIATKGLTHVSLLKLDIEGFELPALIGARRSLTDRIIMCVYFEYFEKQLIRVGPPTQVIDFLDSVGFVTCFCRAYDIEQRGGATHTIVAGQPGHGLNLLPIENYKCLPMTDLLAVPREYLEARK